MRSRGRGILMRKEFWSQPFASLEALKPELSIPEASSCRKIPGWDATPRSPRDLKISAQAPSSETALKP